MPEDAWKNVLLRPRIGEVLFTLGIERSDPRDNERAFRQCSSFVERKLGRASEIFDSYTAAEQNSTTRACRNGDHNR